MVLDVRNLYVKTDIFLPIRCTSFFGIQYVDLKKKFINRDYSGDDTRKAPPPQRRKYEKEKDYDFSMRTVIGPTLPSCMMLLFFWKSSTACKVLLPKIPSTARL